VNGITLDAGGLIALDRNDRRVLALLARAVESGKRITIPATALAQAIRNPARQSRLSRLIRQAGTNLVALDGRDATAVGLLLREPRRPTSSMLMWSSVRRGPGRPLSPATRTTSSESLRNCSW
jgi:hypothetical protein